MSALTRLTAFFARLSAFREMFPGKRGQSANAAAFVNYERTEECFPLCVPYKSNSFFRHGIHRLALGSTIVMIDAVSLIVTLHQARAHQF